MEITNDQELEEAVETVNENLQGIQQYVGSENKENAKIKFPRGYFHRAHRYKKLLDFLTNETLIRNIGYKIHFLHLLSWLLNRTDIHLTPKNMTIKVGLVIMASISESICKNVTKGRIGNKHGFTTRIKRMYEEEKMIDKSLHDDLEWLWGKRDGIHIYLVDELEHQNYKVSDFERGKRALTNLEVQLWKSHYR